MTQLDTTAECRRLEDARTAVTGKLERVTRLLPSDPELGDTWWGGLYDTTAKDLRDIESAMAAAGCAISARDAA